MPFHPATSSLLRYLRRTLPELVDPIETIQWSVWETGNDLPDGMGVIHSGLFTMALQLFNVDKNIPDQGIDFYRDVDRVFEHSQDDGSLPSRTLRDIYRQAIREDPEFYDELSRPPAIDLLEIYDDQYGTNYADKAKALFFQFASALVKADGNVTKHEEAALANLKMLLYQPVSDTVHSLPDAIHIITAQG